MGLNATLVTLTPNTIAHASDVNTSLQNLNAINAFTNGSDTTQIIGHSLKGSSDSGIYNDTHAISIGSGAGTTIKYGHYWNGTNDIFSVTSSFPAYQLSISGAGIACRKSSANCTAGGTVTWLSYTVLFS